MTYMDRVLSAGAVSGDEGGGSRAVREPLVLVVEDEVHLTEAFRTVCDCLNLAVVRMPTGGDLSEALLRCRPLAVVAAMDAAGQDGCNVLMTVAGYDPDLPVLLLTGEDPALLGAVDAVEELWRLTSVTKWSRLGGVGAILDFVFRAGRKGGGMRLMSI